MKMQLDRGPNKFWNVLFEKTLPDGIEGQKMMISAFFVFFVTFFQVPRSNKTAAICCQDPDMAQFFPITNLTKSNLMARTNFELRSILSLRGPFAPAIVNRV